MVLGRDRVQGREPVGRSGLGQVQGRTTPYTRGLSAKTYTYLARDQPM